MQTLVRGTCGLQAIVYGRAFQMVVHRLHVAPKGLACSSPKGYHSLHCTLWGPPFSSSFCCLPPLPETGWGRTAVGLREPKPGSSGDPETLHGTVQCEVVCWGRGHAHSLAAQVKRACKRPWCNLQTVTTHSWTALA